MAKIKGLEHISTRQVAARIRVGKLPEYSDGGEVRCACHPNRHQNGQTECLKFWSKGMRVGCAVSGDWAPALAVHRKLGIVIDTRL